jgi:hypothetical protein
MDSAGLLAEIRESRAEISAGVPLGTDQDLGKVAAAAVASAD